MGSMGRLILLGCEIGIGILVLGDIMAYLMAYLSASENHFTPEDHSVLLTTGFMESAITTHDSEASVLDQRSSLVASSSSSSETSFKFNSTSTTRTNTATTTTTTAAKTNENDLENHRTISPNLSSSGPYTPPQFVLRRYICPKNSSIWPAYYLQAFRKAQESLTKEGNIHVDAPTSSGTRNNKDGCVGKIVLDRKVVKRDVKDGIVGYCEGVSGTVSLLMLQRLWLMNRVIGRGLCGNRGSFLS